MCQFSELELELELEVLFLYNAHYHYCKEVTEVEFSGENGNQSTLIFDE
jgi:hypothetical protein